MLAAAYLGMVVNHEPGPHGDYRGIAFGIEAGAGGGQVTFGPAAGSAYGGARYHLVLLRTWGDSHRVAPHQTFLGGEFRLRMLIVGLGLGAYARVAGDAPGDSRFATVNGFIGW